MPPARIAGGEADHARWAERTFTNALLVIRDGRILFEDYRNRSDASTHFISFSMAKSITSLLVGKALEGTLDPAELSSRTAPAAMLRQLADGMGGSLQSMLTGEALVMGAVLPTR